MPQKITSADLESRYGSGEKIGIHTLNYATGLRVEEADITDDMDTVAVLPSGEELFYCTNSARHVVKDLGHGEVYGFALVDNPVTSRDINLNDGHDFAVVGGRFIVDLWLKHFIGSDRVVFDLKDPADAPKITEIYGDPQKWKLMIGGKFVAPGDPKYPHSKRLQSYEQRQEQALAV